jgi:hypothetical protein
MQRGPFWEHAVSTNTHKVSTLPYFYKDSRFMTRLWGSIAVLYPKPNAVHVIYNTSHYLVKIHFKIILPSMPRSIKWSIPARSWTRICMYLAYQPFKPQVPFSYPSWVYYPDKHFINNTNYEAFDYVIFSSLQSLLAPRPYYNSSSLFSNSLCMRSSLNVLCYRPYTRSKALLSLCKPGTRK